MAATLHEELKQTRPYLDIEEEAHVSIARTAAHYGAVIRTSTQVVGFLKESDRVLGVRVRDTETGDGGVGAMT
mgnify:CR=1 FL=1